MTNFSFDTSLISIYLYREDLEVNCNTMDKVCSIFRELRWKDNHGCGREPTEKDLNPDMPLEPDGICKVCLSGVTEEQLQIVSEVMDEAEGVRDASDPRMDI